MFWYLIVIKSNDVFYKVFYFSFLHCSNRQTFFFLFSGICTRTEFKLFTSEHFKVSFRLSNCKWHFKATFCVNNSLLLHFSFLFFCFRFFLYPNKLLTNLYKFSIFNQSLFAREFNILLRLTFAVINQRLQAIEP